jgi:hypothetical protein
MSEVKAVELRSQSEIIAAKVERESTVDAYRAGYKAGYFYGRMADVSAEYDDRTLVEKSADGNEKGDTE